MSSGVEEALEAKRSEKAQLNSEKQHAAPLKSTYLKCYSECRLVPNLPKNTSRCKGSLMSFSHCVLPHLKIIQNQLLWCTAVEVEVADYGTDRDPVIHIQALMTTSPR